MMSAKRAAAPEIPLSVFARCASVLLPGLVFAVPLFFLTNIYDTYDLPKLTLVALVDLVLICLWFREKISAGALSIRRSALDIPLLAFLGAGILSTVLSIDPSLSLWGSYRIYIFGWAPMMSFSLLYWLTVQAVSPVLTRRVLWAGLISAACVGVYAWLQYYGYEIIPGIPSAAGDRIWSSLGNPVYTGAVCMMALSLGLTRWSLGSGIATLLILVGLEMSLSRSAWMGAGVSACYVAFALRHPIRDHRRKIAAGIVIFIGMALLLPGVSNRVGTMLSTHESSNAARIEGWKGGWRIWWSHPVWGTGPDTFFQAFRPVRTMAYLRAAGPDVTQGHAHNDVIQIAATEGTLGLVLYGWIMAVIGLRLLRARSMTNDGTFGFAAALLALCVQDQFNFSAVSTSAWAAVFAGIVFASEGQISVLRILDSMLIRRMERVALLAFAVVGLWAILIPIRADWHFKQGKAWAQGGQYPIALREFREAVRLNGRVEVYESEQANAARSSGNWDEAWAAAQSLARRHPFNPDAWNNLGVAAMWMTQLAGQDRWQDALTAFQHAVQLDPLFVDAWANLAKYRHLKGDLIEEKTLWEHVLELDPQHEMARRVLGLP